MIKHVIALSGGKDSTAMALRLKELNPQTEYIYYCTPTGNELPSMYDWWLSLGEKLGSRILPVMAMSLEECIDKNRMIPNFRARFCTRQLKIEPAIQFLHALTKEADVFHYVGLRADEEGRVGGVYDCVPRVTQCYPMREWGWDIEDVYAYLRKQGVVVPKRTDCALCFHQRIGEWFDLWATHPIELQKGIDIETKYGKTFRTPGRDTWPVALSELRESFESGRVPRDRKQTELFGGMCRACSL